MPRKEFESFTRLDASDVNTFLMDQSVMSFAGTAARGSAISAPVEGMVSYLEDSESVEIHNGTSFVPALSIGAWTAFTPTWSGLTVGNGVYNTSHYTLVGKTIHVAIDFTLGSTSAVTGDLRVDVPVQISRKNIESTGLLYCSFSDTGTTTLPAFATPSTAFANRFLLRYFLTFAGTNPVTVGQAQASATAPFTWASTDKISFSGTYEVA